MFCCEALSSFLASGRQSHITPRSSALRASLHVTRLPVRVLRQIKSHNPPKHGAPRLGDLCSEYFPSNEGNYKYSRYNCYFLLFIPAAKRAGQILWRNKVPQACVESFSAMAAKIVMFGKKAPAAKPGLLALDAALEEGSTRKGYNNTITL